MRTYLVVDLPPLSLDATDLLNKHADRGWHVVAALTWGNGDNGVILEKHTTRHQDAVALAGEDSHDPPTDNPRYPNPRIRGAA